MKILEHGTVIRTPRHPLGYYAWPSVTIDFAGRLIVVDSGLRHGHIDPFGKTVLHISEDQGHTWAESIIVNDSPIDDRDAGIVALPNGELLISWFTSDTRRYSDRLSELDLSVRWVANDTIRHWSDALVNTHLGSYIRIGTVEKGFSVPLEVGVTAPHGPILLRDGSLLYFGKAYWGEMPLPVQGFDQLENDHAARINRESILSQGPICALLSRDNGRNWRTLGQVPLSAGVSNVNFHEPHVIELSDGSLLGIIRVQHAMSWTSCPRFGLVKTISRDGGLTWSSPEDMGIYGSPPHLIRHSSGVIACTYGYRNHMHRNEPAGHGQRVIISGDEGQTWSEPFILRDDGPTLDLGYPASVELTDGSIFTVYYQQTNREEKTSILYTRWMI